MLDFAFDPPTKMLAFVPPSTRGLSPSTQIVSPPPSFMSELPVRFEGVVFTGTLLGGSEVGC